jgi:hypothetical protein
MIHRQQFWKVSGRYVKVFFTSLAVLSPIFVFLILVIFALGLVQARLMGISPGDGIYFAWVTAFTVGYGDLVPSGGLSRLCAMATALTGMIFTGLWVAVAVNALKMTVQEEEDKS